MMTLLCKYIITTGSGDFHPYLFGCNSLKGTIFLFKFGFEGNI